MNLHNLSKLSALALTALLLGGCALPSGLLPILTPYPSYTPIAPVATTPQVTPTRATPTSRPIQPTTRASPAPTPIEPIATVVATDGKTYKVTYLQAKYAAGGMWIGTRPTRTEGSLMIVLTFVKDRITTTENINIPFASMQRLIFKGVSVPENLKAVFGKQEPIRIEMRDGTFKLLSSTLLVEINAEGTETKRVVMTNYSFKAGETQGQSITLNGFSGRVRTEDGKVGDFFISTLDTVRIEFE